MRSAHVRIVEEARRAGTALSVGLVGNAAETHPALLARGFQPDIVTDQVNSDPYRGYVPGRDDARRGVRGDADGPGGYGQAGIRLPRPAGRRHAGVQAPRGAGLRIRQRHPRERGRCRADRGAGDRQLHHPLHPPAVLRGQGPFRWLAASGRADDIAYIDDLVERTFPEDKAISRWIALARQHIPVEGLPARIGWLGYGDRSKLARLVNAAVAGGELSAPIAFTRDHLDSGSVAYPLRETENMPDGSDAIADWPILNALLACAGGADLVAVHSHGDRWQSAGQTVVADGSPLAEARITSVMDGDTAMGIVRHAEAGVEKAVATRLTHGLTA